MQLLRASGKHTGEVIELSIIMAGSASGDGGVAFGSVLMAFAEAVLGTDDARLTESRAAASQAIGEDGLVDAAGVIGLFNAIDRIADATGIPLEDWKARATQDFREAIGVTAFAVRKAALDRN